MGTYFLVTTSLDCYHHTSSQISLCALKERPGLHPRLCTMPDKHATLGNKAHFQSIITNNNTFVIRIFKGHFHLPQSFLNFQKKCFTKKIIQVD